LAVCFGCGLRKYWHFVSAAKGLAEAFCLVKREVAALGNWLGGHGWCGFHSGDLA
jgi:hypothetical protein